MKARSPSSRRKAFSVVLTLREAGHQALFVGGAVRDLLLGREAADFDVATSARPEEVKALFAEVLPVGERYGVVLVVWGRESVEVATFRRDSHRSDGRRPDSITYTDSPAEDAARRDFTVNGLFLDPVTDEVLDFVHGRRDIDAKVIRCIGDPRARFGEDRLRLLRAVRFASVLGFSIEAETSGALREMAGQIADVTGERVRDELLTLITGPEPGRGLRLLMESGLLAVILPEVDAMAGVEQPPEFHPEGDVFTHTCLTLDQLERGASPVLALAALLHDVGKPDTYRMAERIRFDGHAHLGAEMCEVICRRLRMSRKETACVAELVRDHLKFMDVRKMREARLRRFLTGPLAESHLALHRADCLASHGHLENWHFSREKRDGYLGEPAPLKILITGHDLVEAGFEPGPLFAEILKEVEDHQLDGFLSAKEEALAFVRRRWLGKEDPDA